MNSRSRWASRELNGGELLGRGLTELSGDAELVHVLADARGETIFKREGDKPEEDATIGGSSKTGDPTGGLEPTCEGRIFSSWE